jgi:tetratricopeptide (TPR) repeat protein
MKEEWLDKVVSLRKEGKHEDAEKMIEEKSRIVPKTAQDFFDRGLARRSLRNLEAALFDFQKCVELSPENSEAYLHLGWTLSNLERYEEALKTFEKLIELRPDEMEGHHGRSQSLFALKRYEEVIAYSEELVERLPLFKGFWELTRTAALNQLGRHEEALDSLTSITPEEIKPLPSYAYYLNLAGTFSLLERFDEALKSLQEGMEKTKLEEGCVPCFVGNCWRSPYLEPLRKPPYRERLEEIIGPKPKVTRVDKSR